MNRQNPYSEVYETLSDVLATKKQPHGGAARLYSAFDKLRQDGDLDRAQLCGRASVAILCLENAIRNDDQVKRERMLADLNAIFEQWTAIPLAEVGIFAPRKLAA